MFETGPKTVKTRIFRDFRSKHQWATAWSPRCCSVYICHKFVNNRQTNKQTHTHGSQPVPSAEDVKCASRKNTFSKSPFPKTYVISRFVDFRSLLVIDITMDIYFLMSGLTCKLRNGTFGTFPIFWKTEDMKMHSQSLLFWRRMLFLDLWISAVYWS